MGSQPPYRLDYQAARAVSPAHPAFGMVCILGFAVLVISTWMLAVWSAEKEPFYGRFNWIDAILSVGIGGVLAIGWIMCLSFALMCIIRDGRWRWPAVLLVVAMFHLFCLHFAVWGYICDRLTYASWSGG